MTGARIPLLLVLSLLGGCVKREVSSSATGPELKPQPPPKERILTFETKAVFKEEGTGDFQYHNLIIGKGDSEKSLIWPYDAPAPGKIPSGRALHMEVVEITDNPFRAGGDPQISYDLSKLTDGSRVLYDASVCKVHRLAMAQKVVPISYGLAYFPLGLKEASEGFPHDGTAGGGCSVEPSRTHTRIWVCGKCAERSKVWWAKNVPQR